jgi:hypothetical protein
LAGYQMETYNQMLWVNFCSAIISSFWLLSDASMGKVGRCSLTVSKPELKARLVSEYSLETKM